MLMGVKNCMKGWLFKEDILALNACVIDWRKKIEKLEIERDEARKIAHDQRQNHYEGGDYSHDYRLEKCDLFPWESDVIIGRDGADVTFENTVMKNDMAKTSFVPF